jgi:hypothetical protein
MVGRRCEQRLYEFGFNLNFGEVLRPMFLHRRLVGCGFGRGVRCLRSSDWKARGEFDSSSEEIEQDPRGRSWLGASTASVVSRPSGSTGISGRTPLPLVRARMNFSRLARCSSVTCVNSLPCRDRNASPEPPRRGNVRHNLHGEDDAGAQRER